MHQTLLYKFMNKFDVDGTPSASGPAWSEANRVAGFVEALSNAVDPAKTQRGLHGFGPGNARFPGISFVEAHD